MTGSGRLRRVAGAAMALLTGLAALVEDAGGQEQRESASPQGQPRVVLASQTSWVPPGGELVLRLVVRAPEPPTDLDLAVAVYRRVTSRSEFVQTLSGRTRGVPVVVTPPTPLAELSTDAAGAVIVRLPLQDPALPPDPARLRLGGEGVYPVRVELREQAAGRPVAGLLTHLVHASPPGEGGFALRVAVVVPVHAPLALQPDGRRSMARGRTAALRELGRTLEAHAGVPVTLVPTPETLDALGASTQDADREALATLARADEGRQVAAAPYVPVDVRSLVAARLEDELTAQLDRGNEVVERTLGARPDSRTWVAGDSIDTAALAHLRASQVDRVVLAEDELAPLDVRVTLAQPFELDVRDLRRPAALAADPGLAAHFSPSDDPVLAAHRFLADLAVIYGDLPSRPRVVVAMPPRASQPVGAFLDAVLAGLASAPVLRATTLDSAFAGVPLATTARNLPLARSLEPDARPPALPRADIVQARHRLGAFASMLHNDNRLDDELEKRLLASQAAELRPAARRARLAGVHSAIDRQLARIQVPPSRTVTLTARKGEIPVTVLSTARYPVRVAVQVTSEKLEFPHGAVRELDLARRNTTERFSVRARTSGAFPLRLRLVSPDGQLEVGRTLFTVRSTAASGVGVLLSVGAGMFLLVWWARHLHRGRRNRRLVPA